MSSIKLGNFVVIENEYRLATLTSTLLRLLKLAPINLMIFVKLRSKHGNLMCEFWACTCFISLFNIRILLIVAWIIFVLTLQTSIPISGLVTLLIQFNCPISWWNRVLSCFVTNCLPYLVQSWLRVMEKCFWYNSIGLP